jgi:hypothetical protein
MSPAERSGIRVTWNDLHNFFFHGGMLVYSPPGPQPPDTLYARTLVQLSGDTITAITAAAAANPPQVEAHFAHVAQRLDDLHRFLTTVHRSALIPLYLALVLQIVPTVLTGLQTYTLSDWSALLWHGGYSMSALVCLGGHLGRRWLVQLVLLGSRVAFRRWLTSGTRAS